MGKIKASGAILREKGKIALKRILVMWHRDLTPDPITILRKCFGGDYMGNVFLFSPGQFSAAAPQTRANLRPRATNLKTVFGS